MSDISFEEALEGLGGDVEIFDLSDLSSMFNMPTQAEIDKQADDIAASVVADPERQAAAEKLGKLFSETFPTLDGDALVCLISGAIEGVLISKADSSSTEDEEEKERIARELEDASVMLYVHHRDANKKELAD